MSGFRGSQRIYTAALPFLPKQASAETATMTRPPRDWNNTTTSQRMIAARQQTARRVAPRPQPQTDQDLLDELTTHKDQSQAYQPPQARKIRDARPTAADDQIAPSVRPPVERRQRKQHHPLVYIGGGAALVLVLWVVLVQLWGWFTLGVLDQWNYGAARAASVHGIVLKGDDQTHQTTAQAFLQDGHPAILVIPGDDSGKAKLYTDPQLSGPVALSVALGDDNHDGREDIMVTAWSSTFDMSFHRTYATVVLLNDGKSGFTIENKQ